MRPVQRPCSEHAPALGAGGAGAAVGGALGGAGVGIDGGGADGALWGAGGAPVLHAHKTQQRSGRRTAVAFNRLGMSD